jgi:hypothetical protein
MAPRRGLLRSQVPPEPPSRVQDLLWAWTRVGYERIGANPVERVLARTSPDMRARLDRAQAEAGTALVPQGFNPRPQKVDGRYVLGTLSEHATGNAVDLEPERNLQLNRRTWSALQSLTGTTVDTSSRRWETDPGGLYDDVAHLERRWLDLVDRRVAEAAWVERHVSGEQGIASRLRGPDAPVPAQPLAGRLSLASPESVVGREETRRSVAHQLLAGQLGAKAQVPDLADGFLGLPRDLVLALRGQGLRWGVTFPDRDLHHFEVPEDPLPAVPVRPAP